MIKVAEYIGTMQDGGAETLVRDYALLLNKDIFDIVIIVNRRCPGTANDKILEENGIRIIPVFCSNNIFFKTIQSINRSWYIPYRLAQIINQERINVLHAHLEVLNYLMLVSNRMKDIRLFYTCHSEPCIFFSNDRKHQKKAAQYLIRNNHLQMIALHEQMRNELNNLFGIDNTIIIRNGIDFSRFQNVKEDKASIRKAIGVPSDAFVVGHVGRFAEVKNHVFLVDVFCEIIRKRSDSFLLLVGEGPLRSEIYRKIKGYNIEQKTRILSHRSDIPQLLIAMDVFILPSLYEGFPVSLVEAQIAGVRCLVSDRINEEAIMSDTVIRMSLDDSPQEWAESALDDTIKGRCIRDIRLYDMNHEIKRLEKLYQGEEIQDC